MGLLLETGYEAGSDDFFLLFEIEEIQEGARKTSEEIKTLNNGFRDHAKRTEVLKRTRRIDLMPKLVMYIGDALRDAVVKISQRYHLEELSSAALVAFAAALSEEQLLDSGLPRKYWRLMKRLTDYMDVQNDTSYNTRPECARLLLTLRDDLADPDIVPIWRPLLEWSYEKDIEELAKEETRVGRLLGSGRSAESESNNIVSAEE